MAPPRSVRSTLARFTSSAAIGVALWCILFSFRLVSGLAADTWGVLFFAIAGAAVGATKLRDVLPALLVLAAGMVLVVTLTPLSNALARGWIRRDRLPDTVAAAVLSLSAGVNQNNTMSSGAVDNLLSALTLIKEGKARVLVTSTVQERFPIGTVSSANDQARLVALSGIQAQWLHTPPTGSTRDEALASARLLLPRGMKEVALVTAPMHTRRACAAFEAVGFKITCVAALSRSAGGGNPAPWPEDRLRVFGDWVYEVAATAKYRAAGWLSR